MCESGLLIRAPASLSLSGLSTSWSGYVCDMFPPTTAGEQAWWREASVCITVSRFEHGLGNPSMRARHGFKGIIHTHTYTQLTQRPALKIHIMCCKLVFAPLRLFHSTYNTCISSSHCSQSDHMLRSVITHRCL